MTAQEYLAKNGSRKTAIALLNRRIGALCGMSMDDLPDTTEIWNLVDRIELPLKKGNVAKAIEIVKKVGLAKLNKLAM